jgi:hypothetical protein
MAWDTTRIDNDKSNPLSAADWNNMVTDQKARAPANPLATDTLWDAKGDLVVGTGANTAGRLAAGANGTVPVYASGETTGMIPVAAKRTYHLSCAGGWNPTTAPAGAVTKTETSTNKVNFNGTLLAAGASDIFHEFGGIMPKNWDGSTVTAFPVIFIPTSTDASNHTIKLSLAGVAFGSGDGGDTAYGTKQESTITAAASLAGKVVFGAATSAITVANTPAGNKHVQWRVGRTGDDTYTGDIVILEWVITYTTNNYSDA